MMLLKPRKRFFIHRGIQGSIVIRLLAQWFLFVVATCAVSLVLQLLLDPLSPPEQRWAQLRTSVGAFILVSICLLPMFVRDAVRFSHRFVGPIIRLQSEMRKVDEVKELRPIKLRENDYWQDLAGDYNEFVDRLKNIQRDVELEHSAAMTASASTSPGRQEEVS